MNQEDALPTNRRVLVVDDEAEIRNSYLTILSAHRQQMNSRADNLFVAERDKTEQSSGFEVVAVDQGEVAIDEARAALEREEPYAVAFIDMRMPPGIDGLETAKALRVLDERIYIVFVTAFADRSIDELDEVLEHDTLLLRKPFVSEEIFQLARNLTRTWEKDRQLEASVSRAELELAYHGGVAEISSHILHNFGNTIAGVRFHVESMFDARKKAVRLVEFLQRQQQKQLSGEDVVSWSDLVTAFEGFHQQYLALDELKSVRSAVDYMSETLDQQRALVRDGNPFWYSHFELKELLESAVSLSVRAMEESPITLELHCDEALGEVELPKNPLLQLLVNLLKNSMEAIDERYQQQMGQEGREAAERVENRIRLSAQPVNNHSEGVEIVVEDNGIGLDGVGPVRIFQPGFTTKEAGRGQGLHSAANFVQSLGGEIKAEAGEGGSGARFWVRLPIKQE